MNPRHARRLAEVDAWDARVLAEVEAWEARLLVQLEAERDINVSPVGEGVYRKLWSRLWIPRDLSTLAPSNPQADRRTMAA